MMEMKKIASSLLFITLCLLSGFSSAATVCGSGKIKTLLHTSSSSSSVRFDVEHQLNNNNLYAQTHYGNMISMWYTDSTRWRDKLTMLISAFENKTSIKVISSDNNCMGPQDEFEIVMCTSRRICNIDTMNSDK